MQTTPKCCEIDNGGVDLMGRISNPAARPVQRRLDAADVDLIAEEYAAGRSLRDIAKALGVHHCTVAEHLGNSGSSGARM